MAKLSVQDRTGDVEALLELETVGRTSRAARTIRIVAVFGMIAAVLGVLVYFSSGDSRSPVRYVTQPVMRGDLQVVITATGSVQPTNKVDVSSELSGTVRRVLVDYNSRVEAGQALAELDTDKLKATVESSRAKLDAARARANVAEVTVQETGQDFTRKRALAERSISSVHDLEVSEALYNRAVASLASAKAEIAVAEAELKLNETNLAKACICSPIGGIVLTRNVDPGQTVASTFQAPVLFSIAEDLTQMEVQVDVDEADIGKVKVGQQATFSVDAYPERKFPARIRDVRFASEVVQGVVTYKALLVVDNSELLLRPGMTATAQILVQETKDVLLVPNAALRFSPATDHGAEPQVSLLRRILPGPPRFRPASRNEAAGPDRNVWVPGDDLPTAVPVKTGVTDGKRTEILEGQITSGQEVIVDSVAVTRR
jgi:HlyD family secretion protein